MWSFVQYILHLCNARIRLLTCLSPKEKGSRDFSQTLPLSVQEIQKEKKDWSYDFRKRLACKKWTWKWQANFKRIKSKKSDELQMGFNKMGVYLFYSVLIGVKDRLIISEEKKVGNKE